MGITDILTSLVKENEAYTAELKQELGQCDEGFQEVDTHADACARVVEALNDDDLAAAVEVFLEHFEIDAQADELRSIRTKLDAGETLEAVMTAVRAPELVQEMIATVHGRVGEALARLAELVKSVGEVGTLAQAKAAGIRADWSGWTWQERLGTAPAIRRLVAKAEAARESGGEARAKVQELLGAVEELRAKRAP